MKNFSCVIHLSITASLILARVVQIGIGQHNHILRFWNVPRLRITMHLFPQVHLQATEEEWDGCREVFRTTCSALWPFQRHQQKTLRDTYGIRFVVSWSHLEADVRQVSEHLYRWWGAWTVRERGFMVISAQIFWAYTFDLFVRFVEVQKFLYSPYSTLYCITDYKPRHNALNSPIDHGKSESW